MTTTKEMIIYTLEDGKIKSQTFTDRNEANRAFIEFKNANIPMITKNGENIRFHSLEWNEWLIPAIESKGSYAEWEETDKCIMFVFTNAMIEARAINLNPHSKISVLDVEIYGHNYFVLETWTTAYRSATFFRDTDPTYIYCAAETNDFSKCEEYKLSSFYLEIE